jgi:hypothetical protein
VAARSDSVLGHMALAAQTAPPLLRLTLPPQLARFLIAAGARPAPADSMSVEFAQEKADRAAAQRRTLAVAILRARHAVLNVRYQLQLESGEKDSLKQSIDALDVAVAEVWGSAPFGMEPDFLKLRRPIKLAPRTYDEARNVAKAARTRRPVIVNLTHLSQDDAKRVVSFAAGLVASRGGTIDRIPYGGRQILVAPRRVRRSLGAVLDVELALALDDLLGLIALSYRVGHATADMGSRRVSLIELLRPEMLPLDVSGLDLRSVNVQLDPGVLAGAIWSDDTRWPSAEIASRIRDQSDKVGPSVYRVRTDYDVIVLRYLPNQ